MACVQGYGQVRPYTIASDTILFKSYGAHGSTLIIQNSTKDTIGFLYNTGNGITKFKRASVKLNDSTYVIGGDTLRIHAAGGGGGTWGSITGTLSSQTDLQSALNALVPKTTTVTINGTTQDLSANRTYSVGTLVGVDTASLSARINAKVNISDTASMLSPYLRKVDTANIRLRPIAGTNVTITGTYPNLTFNSTASGTLSTSNFVTRENPSGTVNSSNVTFTLAFTPVSGTENIYLNGLLQQVGGGNDYTISGGTITFVTAPTTGDLIEVNYLK